VNLDHVLKKLYQLQDKGLMMDLHWMLLHTDVAKKSIGTYLFLLNSVECRILSFIGLKKGELFCMRKA